ncbi:hypothetical protein LCGC14_2635650, partial [marine sediment metagenome]
MFLEAFGNELEKLAGGLSDRYSGLQSYGPGSAPQIHKPKKTSTGPTAITPSRAQRLAARPPGAREY